MLPVAVPSRNGVRRLALARAVSFFGSTSAYVALAAVVYARTGSAIWVAAVAAASFATPALASPLAGTIADRHDRRAVMVCSDLLGALCFVAMALASAPAALVGIKVVAALVAAPLVPATSAALPALAPEGELARANSTLAVGGTVGALAGPLAGGALVAVSGASLVFALNAATFLVSALLLATLRFGRRPESEEAHSRRSTPGAGFALLRRDPALRRLAIGIGLVSLGIGTTLAAELPLVDAFGGGPAGYGAMVSAWGFGGLIGARLAGGLLRRRGERAVLTVAFAGVAVAFLAGGLAPFLAVALVALAVGGAAEGLGEVARQLMLQRRAPDEVRARALAAAEAVAQGGLAASLIYAGFVVNALGPRWAFALAAGLCALAALASTVPLPGIDGQRNSGTGRFRFRCAFAGYSREKEQRKRGSCAR